MREGSVGQDLGKETKFTESHTVVSHLIPTKALCDGSYLISTLEVRKSILQEVK